jgi:TonB family protein
MLAIILALPSQSDAEQAASLSLPAVTTPDPQSKPGSDSAEVSIKSMTQPEYPRAELNNGITGTVRLLLFVDKRGIPTDVLVERSSGNNAFDNAATSAAHDWKFNPERKNGVAVSSVARQQVAFAMEPRDRIVTLEGSKTIDGTTLAILVRLADQGSADVQNYLGVIYSTGDGVSKDAAKAVGWLQKAAAQGHTFAQTTLGWLYENGAGVTRDTSKAMELYEKAAAQGNAIAEVNLGSMFERGDGVPKDSAKAVEWFQKAAAQGQSNAEYNLGWQYVHGEGAPRDVPKAMEWYEKAAAHGDARAANNLGWILAQGDGVPKDAAKAIEWYRKAAVKGNVPAYGNLGWMYEHGEGVPRDDVLAYAWLTVAATQGLDTLAATLGVEPETKDLLALEKRMTQDQRGEAKRLASSWAKGQLLSHDAK